MSNGIKLAKATPYMLRDDGRLLTCGDMHPYIKYIFEDSDENQLNDLFAARLDHLIWFYRNTKQSDTKMYINRLASMIYINNPFNFNDFQLKAINSDFEIIDDYVASIPDMLMIFQDLNDFTNQEFCRVRTSNIKFGGNDNSIYFRISSIQFDWFNIIWELVYENRHLIDSITVCKDQQTFGGRLMYYRVGDTQINNLSTDEFIALGGNPVIEMIDLDFGIKMLKEGHAFTDAFPKYKKPGQIHEIVCRLIDDYIKNNFV